MALRIVLGRGKKGAAPWAFSHPSGGLSGGGELGRNGAASPDLSGLAGLGWAATSPAHFLGAAPNLLQHLLLQTSHRLPAWWRLKGKGEAWGLKSPDHTSPHADREMGTACQGSLKPLLSLMPTTATKALRPVPHSKQLSRQGQKQIAGLRDLWSYLGPAAASQEPPQAWPAGAWRLQEGPEALQGLSRGSHAAGEPTVCPTRALPTSALTWGRQQNLCHFALALLPITARGPASWAG